MRKFFVVLGVILLAGAGAWATAEGRFDRMAEINPVLFQQGVYIGPSVGTYKVQGSNTNKITRTYGASATIDFASTSVGTVLSSSITVTGARAGDPCFVGVPTAAGALSAAFSCFVDATDSVKVKFAPLNVIRSSVTLSSGTPSTATATVVASSVCTCSPVGTSAAIAGASCAVSLSSTTLTVTGPDSVTTVVNYECIAPVDPASGTYYVRVISAQ